MTVDVKFICCDCAEANREKRWADQDYDEWESFSEALEHQLKHPTHHIRATADVEIHL